MAENGLMRLVTDDRIELPSVLGLTLPDDTPIEKWGAVGDRIRVVGRSMGFMVGDWLNFGEDHYGEEFAQYAENCGYDPGVLSTYQAVARRFGHELRDSEVSFSHYRLLAKLTDKQAARWIDKIKEGKMSVAELREAIVAKELEGEVEEAERGRPRVTKITAKWSKRLKKSDAERIQNYLEREGADVTISL